MPFNIAVFAKSVLNLISSAHYLEEIRLIISHHVFIEEGKVIIKILIYAVFDQLEFGVIVKALGEAL